jgi:Flp pilus assembly protein TadD
MHQASFGFATGWFSGRMSIPPFQELIMPRSSASLLIPVLAVLTLTGCSVPSEPEGINEQGMARVAQRLQERGDDEGAAGFYLRALKQKPDDLMSLRNLGKIFEAHGDSASAEAYYAKALKQAPDDRELQQAEGRTLIRLGRMAEARDVYWSILQSDTTDVKALNGLGITLDYLGQHEEAQKSYHSALDREPNNLVALNNLAHSYVLVGRYQDAITLLEPHAKDRSATPALRQNLAEAYGLAGMYADSERMARVDLKPDEVKRNLAYYRAKRAKLAPDPKLVAVLGTYATSEMADARAEVARALAGDGVTVAVKPEVQAPGGIPKFAVEGSGFTDEPALNNFCEAVIKNDIECKAVKK